jgi:hypothetical protein
VVGICENSNEWWRIHAVAKQLLGFKVEVSIGVNALIFE